MSKTKIFERILSTGYALALLPLNYLIGLGYMGRVLCILVLVFYSIPILIVFNVIGFTFWIFKK